MSIFSIGGTPQKIPQNALLPEMYQDKYFMPGTIHGGEDYLIRVYLNDSHCETENDSDQFEIDFITRSLILEAKELDPSLGQKFYDHLFTAENFCCRNDGKSDFFDGSLAEIIRCWHQSVSMSCADLVRWAEDNICLSNPENRLVEIDGNHYGILKPTGDVINLSCGETLHEGEYLITRIDVPWRELSESTIALDDGWKLIAEKNPDKDYREIFVYLKDPNNAIWQDLAIVSENYTYDDEGNTKPINGSYSVKVYTDPETEDWTTDFNIGRYQKGEE